MQTSHPTPFFVVDRQHPERAALEAFIARVFKDTYDAQVAHFADTLLGWKGSEGQWLAALGYTAAADSDLFVEQYGDEPVEQRITRKLGVVVRREWLVEVGNLAAIHAGAARSLIAAAIEHLHRMGHAWVVFTATRALLNSFDRLDVRTIELGSADPARLPDGGQSWGRYYQTRPSIMTGSITLGYVALRARMAARQSARMQSAEHLSGASSHAAVV